MSAESYTFPESTEHPAQTIQRDSRPTVTLYHGDNGHHEFYESEATTDGLADLLIIRHRNQPDWFVLSSQLIDWESVKAGPLSAVIREVATRTGRTISVDPSREWEHISGVWEMQLTTR